MECLGGPLQGYLAGPCRGGFGGPCRVSLKGHPLGLPLQIHSMTLSPRLISEELCRSVFFSLLLHMTASSSDGVFLRLQNSDPH